MQLLAQFTNDRRRKGDTMPGSRLATIVPGTPHGPRFEFPLLTAADLPRLHEWVQRPHVAHWTSAVSARDWAPR